MSFFKNRSSEKNSIDWSIFKARARIINSIRSFFKSNGFLEVDVPAATPYPSLDSNIYSMETSFHNDRGDSIILYLHTSPEHSMKKLLALGAERIFFIGKVFRDRELTHLHNPEFTLLEWYRKDATYSDIMNDTVNMIRYVADDVFSTNEIIYQNRRIDLSSEWECRTISELFRKHVGIDLNKDLSIESLKKGAKAQKIRFDDKDEWETLFFRIFLEKIEPELRGCTPIFVKDYPVQLGLMAKRKQQNQNFVERLELYIGGVELANGYSELLDPDEQRERFLKEQKKKQEKEGRLYTIDDELVSALEKNIPPSAGMALGVDRLIMLFLDKNDIRDVILFPLHEWIEARNH